MNHADEGAREGNREADFYLLQRIAIGIVALGMDEAVRRLREWQENIDNAPEQIWGDTNFTDETPLQRFSYFLLGSVLNAEKSGVRLASEGIQVAQNVSRTAENVMRPFLHNRLTRPFEKRIAKLSGAVDREVRHSINEGRYENRRGRALAEASFEQTVNEVIDYMARNPEVVELIQRQSMGLAGEMIDNGRGLGVAADSAVEMTLRRLLRMTPREQLPDSPLTGVPQDMYDPERRTPSDGSA